MVGQSVHWSGRRARRADRHFHSSFRRRFDRGVFRHIWSALKDNGTVLDLGAGTGYLTLEVAAQLKDGKVIAVDESRDMLEQLTRRVEQAGFGQRVETLRADVVRTGLPGDSIDLVISANLLHEVDNPNAVLGEIDRVLRPGGVFVVQDFRNGLFWKVFRRFHPDTAKGPLRVRELHLKLEQLGFEEVAIQMKRFRYIASGRKRNGADGRSFHVAEHKRAG
jgi:ubiquinone/menaquinone biosynthesis C-methylase UbiE